MKGPILNNNSKNIVTRDSLGIEGVVTTISRALCPVVNTVTPRAFYWPFMVWIYYDFYKHSGIAKRDKDSFDKPFLKRQDYFFVLSQLLTNAKDQYNLTGKDNVKKDISQGKKSYTYNPEYYQSNYGGMQYYNAGCISLRFLTDEEDGNRLSFPKLTQYGEKMALAFESKIKDTEYYKNYRLKDVPVPEDVLIEYGSTINIALEGFEDCKKLLSEHLFDLKADISERLIQCARYLKQIYSKYDMRNATLSSYREILFDCFSVRGGNEKPESGLELVSRGWEIVVGRQYFTMGLESIWKYMLEQIYNPLSKKQWIEKSIESSKWSFDIKANLSSVMDSMYFSFKEREDMIYDAAHLRNRELMVENGLKVILSIYNRFVGRTDLGEAEKYLSEGTDTGSISLMNLIETVEEYKYRPIEDFVVLVMGEWLIEQHKRTAITKMLQKKDGFYYEIINGRYTRRLGFSMEYQGIRLYQLAQVMKDLGRL